MSKFIHISVDNKIITKDTFIKPDFTIFSEYRNILNPPVNTLYLSMANKDNTSDWFSHCVKKGSSHNIWINKTQTVFEIKMDNIIVLNNANDLCMFFEKYGNYRKRNIYYKNCNDVNLIDVKINEVIEIINMIINYIDSLTQKKRICRKY